MSLLRNLTGITTPASTDLFYVVQNNTDYKMTSEQFMNFAKSAIVVSLTQAQYDALTPAEKSNGSIYLINDATLSASDIAYGQGTVEDSLDDLSDATAVKWLNSTLTLSSGVSILYGSTNQVGKQITICVVLKITANIANEGLLISGLPSNAYNIRIPKYHGTNEYNPTDISGGIFMTSRSGQIKQFQAITASSVNPHYIFLNFIYFTE